MDRFLPLIGVGSFFLVGLLLRAILQYAWHGHSGLIIFQDRNWRGNLRDAAFLSLAILLLAESIGYALQPAAFGELLLFAPSTWRQFVGGTFILGGTGLMLAAQLRMGASWRVGIDPAAKPGLVTSGLYRVCRNPIYLALLIVLSGICLTLPTLLSLVASLGIWYCLRTQTRHEEKYLLQTYGDEYRAYATRVGRFLPGLGRLAAE